MMKAKTVLISVAMLLVAATLSFAGQGSSAASSSGISADELYAALASSQPPIVADVRTPEDFNRGHIPGAVSVPFNTVTSVTWNKNYTIVLYCSGTGCPLSTNSAAQLAAAGYISVRVLRGGLAEWSLRGYVVEGTGSAGRKEAVCRLIQAKELRELLASSGVAVLDARPKAEYAAGHIQSAKSLPLEEMETAFPAMPSVSRAIIVDRLPERARRACSAAASAGLSAEILSGATAVWAALGYPLVTGDYNGK